MTTDGSTLLCPVSSATEIYGEEWDWPGVASTAYPPAPDPGPGDPDDAYVAPNAHRYGRRLQLLFCEPITHRALCEARSFRTTKWSDRHGAPGEISGEVSMWDPAWDVVGITRTVIRGRSTFEPDYKGLEVLLVEDGVPVATGIFHQPMTSSGDWLTLTVSGPEAVLDERTLGETEQEDFYGGVGSFPTTDLAGWEFSSGIVREWNTTTPWEGARSLRVRTTIDDAPQWVYGPWVNLEGQDGWVRHPVGSAVLRSTSAAQGIGVYTFVQLPGGSPVRFDFSLAEAGVAAEDETDWQGPITSRGWLTPNPVTHRVRVGILVPGDGSWLDIDYVRLQWPTLTGYVSQQDLCLYPGRVLRDAQYREGRSPWGISWIVRTLTGITDRISWAHQDDHPVGDAIHTITDRDDGPDFWITPAWQAVTSARRGRDRRDVSLTGNTVRRCKITFDPGGEVDELRALTDLGTGPARVLHGVDQPRRTNRRRIRSLTHVPPGSTFDSGRAWTAGEAEFAARRQFSAEVTVSYDDGRLFGIGDGVMAALVDGTQSFVGPVRVTKRDFVPASEECVLSVGIDPLVDL